MVDYIICQILLFHPLYLLHILTSQAVESLEKLIIASTQLVQRWEDETAESLKNETAPRLTEKVRGHNCRNTRYLSFCLLTSIGFGEGERPDWLYQRMAHHQKGEASTCWYLYCYFWLFLIFWLLRRSSSLSKTLLCSLRKQTKRNEHYKGKWSITLGRRQRSQR